MSDPTQGDKTMLSKHVIVTTNKDRHGVFYGLLESRDGDKVVLTDARNIIYWSAKTRGVFGLAVTGPADGSRVGPAVPHLDLDDVTAIAECTPEAVARFQEDIWS